jgi:hypothetical protein
MSTSQKTHFLYITKIKWLMLLREIVSVYCDDH